MTTHSDPTCPLWDTHEPANCPCYVLPVTTTPAPVFVSRGSLIPAPHCRECADDGTLTTAALAWLHERGWGSVDCDGMYVPLEDDYAGCGEDDDRYANER